jgi:hypothetical protein
MIYLRLILTILLPLLLGFSIVAVIYREKTISFLERFALAWGIGLGILGMSIFTLSLFGVRLTLIISALPSLFLTISLLIFAIVRKYPIYNLNSVWKELKGLENIFTQPNHPRTLAEKLLALLIILITLYVFFDATVKPIVNFDDLWRQGCIARIIYVKGEIINEQTTELAGGHPYLNPISQAWIYFGIGEWNDALGKIVFAIYFLTLLMVFYAGVRRYTDRFHSILFTFLLTTFPLLVYHAGTAYSDLMQTFYYTAGVLFLYHWFNSNNNLTLISSALIIGLGIFVKQLGTPLWLILLFVLGLYLAVEQKRQFQPLGKYFMLSFLVSLPWLVNSQSFILNYGLIFWHKLFPVANGPAVAAVITAPYGPPNLGGIVSQIWRRMYFYADWQILWFVLPLSLIFSWQKFWSYHFKYLGLILVFSFLMMVYGFTEQNAYTYLVDGTLVQRMMMYQVPLALLIIAVTTKTLFAKK